MASGSSRNDRFIQSRRTVGVAGVAQGDFEDLHVGKGQAVPPAHVDHAVAGEDLEHALTRSQCRVASSAVMVILGELPCPMMIMRRVQETSGCRCP